MSLSPSSLPRDRRLLALALVALMVAAVLTALSPGSADAAIRQNKARQLKNRAAPAISITGSECLQYVTDTHLQYVTKVACLPSPASSVQLWTYDAASGRIQVTLQQGTLSKLLCLDSLAVLSPLGIPLENVPVQVLPCLVGDIVDGVLKAPTQQWDYDEATGALRNRANGHCLGSALNISLTAVPLVTLRCNGAPSQGWDSVGPNTYGGTVWSDTNGNGKLDLGEGGRGGVRVHLLDGDGNPFVPDVSTTTNDPLLGLGGGNFRFEGLEPGSYRVRVDAPAGFGFTVQNAPGTNEYTDSDVDGSGLGDPQEAVEPGLLDLAPSSQVRMRAGLVRVP